jgi:hypothetical protein
MYPIGGRISRSIYIRKGRIPLSKEKKESLDSYTSTYKKKDGSFAGEELLLQTIRMQKEEKNRERSPKWVTSKIRSI